jgi:hypothetical protein
MQILLLSKEKKVCLRSSNNYRYMQDLRFAWEKLENLTINKNL